MKSDERILGSSDFVERILAFSGEHHVRRYDSVRRGYGLDRIVNRVAEILEMQPDEILSESRRKKEVVARSLLYFWAARELGLSLTELARHLEITVRRGQKIARENSYRLF